MKKKNNNSNSGGNFLGVPEDNILDLKNLKKAKSKISEQRLEKPNDRVLFWEKMTNDATEKKKIKQDKKQERILKKQQKVKLKKERIKIAKPKPILKKDPVIKKTKQPKIKKEITFKKFWYKNVVTFVIISLILIIPIYVFGFYRNANTVKESVINIAEDAIKNLLAVGDDLQDFDIDSVDSNLVLAVDNFTKAQDELEKIGSIATSLAQLFPPTKKQFESAAGLLEAGKQISQAGQSLTNVSQILADMDIDDKTTGITTPLSLSQVDMQTALDHLLKAEEALINVDMSVVTEDQKAEVELLKNYIPTINRSFEDFYYLTDGILEILGHSQTKRYLLLFQNSNELRATGGFVSSLALIDISKGLVKNIEVPSGGAYDFQGQLKEKVIAPQPLHLVNPHWQLQDANWWPDFPTSAEKIMWFYEKSGGPTVDGVITLTPQIIEEFLAQTGSIDMQEEYGLIVDADNFLEFTESVGDDDEIGKPKKFIADLAPILLNTLLSEGNENWFSLLNTLATSLSEKQILLYFSDNDVQNKISKLGWTGEVKETNNDYLMVVNTNISGGKTDGMIDQLISHNSEIQDDGSIINTVNIKRIHTGSEVKNVNYMRIYVPEGSEFIEATGFSNIWKNLFLDPDEEYQVDEYLKNIEQDKIIEAESNTTIYNESNKTVFGNWVETNPGETSEITIKYLLPFKVHLDSWFYNYDNHSLLIQKQPGTKDDVFNSNLIWPSTHKSIWTYPKDDSLKGVENGLKYQTLLDTDKFYGIVLNKK